MSGKYTKAGKRSFGSRFVYLMLALVLVLGCTVGGTLAWLTAQTEEVENTFVAGQIGTLKLTETDTDPNTTGEQHQYIVIPGVAITKDPKVTYTPTTAGGTVPVDAYVFVELTGIGQTKWTWNETEKQYVIKSGDKVVLSFEIADGWKPVPNVDDVYYREVGSVTDGWAIIKDDNITVSDLITKEDVESVAAAADKLTFAAYAIQQASGDADDGIFTPAEAWAKVNPSNG